MTKRKEERGRVRFIMMHRSISAIFLLFVVSACTRAPQSGPASPGLPRIAELTGYFPSVTYRRHNEPTWEDCSLQMPFFSNDAVRTASDGAARIRFLSGSLLELRPNTHVVLTDKSSEPSRLDRAVVQRGELRGKTKDELWLIYGRTLFRLKAKSPVDEAQARYSLESEKKLTIQVDGGEGEFHRRPAALAGGMPDAIQSTRLDVGKSVTFDVLPETEFLGWQTPELQRGLAAQVPAASSPKPLSFEVDLPPDNSELNRAKLSVKGKISGPGGRLLVNGNEVFMEKGQTFAMEIALRKGANRVLIQLIRPTGESVYRQWVFLRRR